MYCCVDLILLTHYRFSFQCSLTFGFRLPSNYKCYEEASPYFSVIFKVLNNIKSGLSHKENVRLAGNKIPRRKEIFAKF